MKTDPSGRDPDAAITARAREATKELFDEDIVRPELEFDEASFNLFAGLITAALCAVRDETLSKAGPYMQHHKNCDVVLKRAEMVTCPFCDGTGRAKESQHQMKQRDGTPWPENNCAPCAGNRNHEWLKYPTCTCGFDAIRSRAGGGT